MRRHAYTVALVSIVAQGACYASHELSTDAPLASVSEVAAGVDFACARLSTGGVVCWGANDGGQLGNGSRDDALTPVDVLGLTDAVEIDAGNAHACARRASGNVVCWGFAGYAGALGDGSDTGSASPVEVEGLSDAVDVAVGGTHACAVRAAGSVVCWGGGEHGQLGDGATSHAACGAGDCALTPVVVVGIGEATAVVASATHSCALERSGTVSCWGDDGFGQLGDDTTTSRAVPTTVLGLTDAVELVARNGYTTCARRVSGAVACWGWNIQGQLGDGHMSHAICPGTLPDVSSDCSSVPTAVMGLRDAVSITVGFFHACAARASGSVVCWGMNLSGQLGDASTELRSYVPVPASVLDDADDLSGGMYFTCARRASGRVACWGANERGQLGDGSTSDRATPVEVAAGAR